jgi:hypothetical protein
MTFAMLSNYRHMSYGDSMFVDPKAEKIWQKAVIRTAIHNPNAMRKDRACVAKTIFGSEARYIKYTTDMTIQSNLPYVEAHPLLGTTAIKHAYTKWLAWSANHTITNFIFWSAVPALAISLAYMILSIRKRLPGTFAYTVMMIANPLLVVLIASSSDYRYIYSLVIGGPLSIIIYFVETRLRRRAQPASILRRTRR